ncbi:hypothetical protein ASC94_28260 [Massilia sp. Root418]|uniref:DUF2946 domain-containing protein n=1 Tax=Massilia sp. Root418 TaxID=1736532 RepID=UPI0006F93429|nr:DUF2946 domain-containing protein [Massilia sp. Root418]KQW87293.1 hypothetical protein ASC94_28260 [Massilia sp. Root418]
MQTRWTTRWQRQAQWIWIAIIAVLMNALAPSISHALAAAEGNPAAFEICRADKSKPLPAPFLQMDGEEDRKAMSMGEDCGYCATHAGSFGMPPSMVSGLPFAVQSRLHPFLFYRAPQPLAAWSASRPRGPPAHA